MLKMSVSDFIFFDRTALHLVTGENEIWTLNSRQSQMQDNIDIWYSSAWKAYHNKNEQYDPHMIIIWTKKNSCGCISLKDWVLLTFAMEVTFSVYLLVG